MGGNAYQAQAVSEHVGAVSARATVRTATMAKSDPTTDGDSGRAWERITALRSASKYSYLAQKEFNNIMHLIEHDL